jgi:hypothetical protein
VSLESGVCAHLKVLVVQHDHNAMAEVILCRFCIVKSRDETHINLSARQCRINSSLSSSPMAPLEINKADLFVAEVDQETGRESEWKPVRHGLFDPRLEDGYEGRITFASTLFDDEAIRYLVVPPPAERPMKRGRHHALTRMLVEIIAENERLKRRRQSSRSDLCVLEELVGRYMFRRFQPRRRSE